MILLIDNYDSFTYNLYQLLAKHGREVKVVRNDQITLEEIAALHPESIVISPGPGRPEEAGICVELIRQFAPRLPILGVCLGHQAIGMAFGAKIVRAGAIVHGKRSPIFHTRQGVFERVSLPFKAGRYHSLMIEKESLPAILSIEAETPDGCIMAVRHRHYPCFGIQFHPESILTEQGDQLISNFLQVGQPC